MHRIAWPFRAFGVVMAGALLLSAVVVAAAPRLWRIANAHEELPVDLPAFAPLSQRTYVYDVYGATIAVFERENSQPITLEQVPDDVVAALLAVEDNEFWIHHGVNVRGIFRALTSNFSSDAPVQGASTITQQVVKNEFLAGLPRDARYKGLQIHYASMLEKEMSKELILERYLNTVFFGNNAYGLQAAAEVYFGKDVGELTMVEGAFLAGLVRSPTGYDPIRRLERSRARFRQVTERLAEEGLISEYRAGSLGETWPLPEIVRTLPTLQTKPTYYTEALRQYLLERSNLLGETEQERANLLYRGGLRIHTTLDPFLQAHAENARKVLPTNDKGFDAAIVSLDSTTGAIRAMVGGSGFQARDNAVNMALEPRQTGSSIKIFILSAALQAGAEPNDVINGLRGCKLPIPDDDDAPPFEITGGVGGKIGTLREMTTLSLNCGYARLSQIVGLNRVVDTTYRMAHSTYLYEGQPETEREPINAFASYATGANAMSALDMASGMQTIANQGEHHDPYYVERIDRVDGTRFYTHTAPGTQVLDPGVALTALDIMKGVLTGGTARQELSDFSRPAAGKTGTQDDNTNAWFVGSTPQLTTAVWVGDPDAYTPMVCGTVEGEAVCNIEEFLEADGFDSITGGTYPARIWGAFMEAGLATAPIVDWPAAPATTRPAVRLYLPGNECLGRVVSVAVPGGSTTTTVPLAGILARTPAPPTDPVPTDPVPAEPVPTEPVPTAVPDTVIEETSTTTTAPPTPIVQQVESGTTIPPDVLDPKAPLPSVDLGTLVFACATPPPGVVVRPPSPPSLP